MPKRIKRLPHPPSTRMKISESMEGHAVKEETKAKISASLKGKAKSEATRAKIAHARRLRPRWSAVDACRMAAKQRYAAFTRKRLKKYRRDLFVAWQSKKYELWEDIRVSWGWKNKRTMFDPIVSDGVDKDGMRKKRLV